MPQKLVLAESMAGRPDAVRPARGAAESVPVENETSERVVRVMVFGVPPAALVLAGWLAWGGTLHWQDLLVLAVTYTLSGLGVTVGYHRLFTHRSFKTTRGVRALLAVLGSMAVEGPLLEWVATHRKHHRFSDQPGDPHSPHLDHAPGWRGALHGLGHAHVGWMFRGKDMADPGRYAKDLLADRDLCFISRTFPL
jgi:stearoyl-CoA desaturase (delta-9 desaturase)